MNVPSECEVCNCLGVFAFIDTNLLLHFDFFDQVDWHKELGTDRVTR